MKTFFVLTLALVLTGCGTTSQQWAETFSAYGEKNRATRSYIDDPIKAPALKSYSADWSKVPGSYPSQNNGQQRYMLNTPNGIQYRTCTNLQGGNVYCH